MLTDPVQLALRFDWPEGRHPAPRDFIAVLYDLEVLYADALMRAGGRRTYRFDRPEAAGEWRHWITRGGFWPLDPPPMPDVPKRAQLRIHGFEMASPLSVLLEVPAEAWAGASAAAGSATTAIAVRLKLVVRIVAALETLAGARGRMRNAALEEQVREALNRGDLAEAELLRLTSEDELEEYRRASRGRFTIEDARLDLPPTPEAEWEEERMRLERPAQLPSLDEGTDEPEPPPEPPLLPRGRD